MNWNLKELVKHLVGERKCLYFKGLIELTLKMKYKMKGYYKCNTDCVNSIVEYGQEGYDTFCGYYDYFPLSKDGQYLLCQRVKCGSNTAHDCTEIGYYMIKSGRFEFLTKSSAWNWQQGSRLHWSNVEENVIFYNDIDNSNYCTKVFDVLERKVKRIISPALYDISKSEKIGASVNFARLQRLRPGYGYSKIEDDTFSMNAPQDDGLLLVDIRTGEKSLAVSLQRLASDVDEQFLHQHYINHVSFSPSDDKIMFFHIWTDDKWPGWMTRLCIYYVSSGRLQILESEKLVSHYCWMDDNTLLITGADKQTKEAFYRVYDVNGKYTQLDKTVLNNDGHPTYDESRRYIISDTYPNEKSIQKVFLYSFNHSLRTNLLDVFSDPRLAREYRCDLHPKCKDNIIVIDSTYKNCSRNILLLSLNDTIR